MANTWRSLSADHPDRQRVNTSCFSQHLERAERVRVGVVVAKEDEALQLMLASQPGDGRPLGDGQWWQHVDHHAALFNPQALRRRRACEYLQKYAAHLSWIVRKAV